MNDQTRIEYRRQRCIGGGIVGEMARCALDRARTSIEFSQLTACNLVRLRIEPDESPDLSWLDQTDEQMGRGFEQQAKQIRATALAEGVWGIIGEYNAGDGWTHADSCWGFIADEWKDSGYDYDIMAETIRQLRAVAPSAGELDHATTQLLAFAKRFVRADVDKVYGPDLHDHAVSAISLAEGGG